MHECLDCELRRDDMTIPFSAIKTQTQKTNWTLWKRIFKKTGFPNMENTGDNYEPRILVRLGRQTLNY